MAARTFLLATLLMAALAGCAELRAERPLFAPEDQAGPAPLTEGVWIAVSDECPERLARSRGRFPADCTPFDLRRGADGAWRVDLRMDLAHGLSREERAEVEESGPFRLVIAPAIERALRPDEFAPLYVAELRAETTADSINYLVIMPTGAFPATAVHVTSISCEDILRDGAIEGITSETPEHEVDSEAPDPLIGAGCIASTQAAVREAARRAVVEDFETLISTRYVRARP